jgi:hypothetical protein
LSATEKDDIEEEMGRDKLNGEVKIDDKIIKNRPKNVQNGD